jgi:hypothetical protein
MKLFQEISKRMNVPVITHVPGEHDAGLDGGALYRDFFAETYYSFDHRSVHFLLRWIMYPALNQRSVTFITTEPGRSSSPFPIQKKRPTKRPTLSTKISLLKIWGSASSRKISAVNLR